MLATAVKNAVARLPNGRPRSDLNSDSRILLKGSWERLLVEALRLRASGCEDIFDSADCLTQEVVKEILGCVTEGELVCRRFANLYPPGAACVRRATQLRVGMGSPGYTGCLNIDGSRIAWNIFTDRDHGILVAMHSLDLHILGLPGASLLQMRSFCC